jgi:hypothetical protein
VQQGAEEYQHIRQNTKEVGRVFGDQEESADSEEGKEGEPASRLQSASPSSVLSACRVFHHFLQSVAGRNKAK